MFEDETQPPSLENYDEIEEQDSPPPQDISHALLEKLSSVPVSLDELIRQCHFSCAEIQKTLLELEMEGSVERHSGGLFTKVES